jgi:hypothetical protein
MNPNEHRLKSCIETTISDSGLHYGQFRREFDVDELFAGVLDTADTPAIIAAKALIHLCGDDGSFNGNTAALKAVFVFLSELATDQPEADADVKACQLDLKESGFTLPEAEEWVQRWYKF